MGCRVSGSPFLMDAAVLCPAVATVLDGLGTMGTGASAISTGISLFGCNPVLNVLGVISIVVGAATVAAGLIKLFAVR